MYTINKFNAKTVSNSCIFVNRILFLRSEVVQQLRYSIVVFFYFFYFVNSRELKKPKFDKLL
jgi:hypothetical protein